MADGRVLFLIAASVFTNPASSKSPHSIGSLEKRRPVSGRGLLTRVQHEGTRQEDAERGQGQGLALVRAKAMIRKLSWFSTNRSFA